MKFCKNRIISRISLGFAFALGSAISVDAANIPAFTTVGIPSTINASNINIATRFQVNPALSDPITVTALGAYLGGLDGPTLETNRTITLWNDFGGLEASITVPQSTTGSEFAFVSLGTPLTLNPGDIYRIAGFIDPNTDGDNAVFGPSGLNFASQIIPIPPVNTYRTFSGSGFPDDQLITAGYQIAANFLFDDGTNGGGGPNPDPSVPEPSLIGGLLLFVLGGLVQKRRDET